MTEFSSSHTRVVLAGAGPAGLTAAYVLAKAGIRPLVLEKSEQVGGISRTETYNGYRFDIGGHRVFTKVGEVEALWHEILGDDFIETPRMSRNYYKGKFSPYPLVIWSTLQNLGLVESARIGFSYLAAHIRRSAPAQNLEEWATERFGKRLYDTFFQTYTEKVWGIPCTEIRADWAAQRIKQLSLKRAALAALWGKSSDTSLVGSFQYPCLGPGMMWERATEHIENMGGTVEMETAVTRITHQPATASGDGAPMQRRRIISVTLESAEGETMVHPEHLVSSMPITHLIRQLDPPAPEAVLKASESLSYRDFLIVTLVVDAPDLFPDNWIYIHSPEVQVGRIQNFKNWSPEMVPDASKTCLGLEYFCTRGDGIWTSSDEDLIALAKRELAEIGLSGDAIVEDGTVIRQPMAYPVYDEHYKQHVATLQEYLGTFVNLQTVGRAGMHRYNNQDHSMLTALLAARNILCDPDDDTPHDLWNVNVERSYHEDFVVDEEAKMRAQEARRRPLPKHYTEPA